LLPWSTFPASPLSPVSSRAVRVFLFFDLLSNTPPRLCRSFLLLLLCKIVTETHAGKKARALQRPESRPSNSLFSCKTPRFADLFLFSLRMFPPPGRVCGSRRLLNGTGATLKGLLSPPHNVLNASRDGPPSLSKMSSFWSPCESLVQGRAKIGNATLPSPGSRDVSPPLLFLSFFFPPQAGFDLENI